jgi:hypothetical protein
MKNKVLSIFHTAIPYVKELRDMAGSMEGCILMQQLDYWFLSKPDGFYKFLEPVSFRGMDEHGNPIPGHPLYRVGDSWCEELNCTPHEFRRMFDAIGARWNSKGEYINAADPFCNRGYCSYVDRKQNMTYYFRNHALVDAFLDRFVADGAQRISTSGKRSTDLGGLNPQSSQKLTSIEQRLPAEITFTATGGVNDMNCKTKTPVWQEGELHGSLDEFISAALWMQHKSAGIRNPTGFKSAVRKRITAEGPNTEDWETLTSWRASQTKPVGTADNTEDIKLAAEQRQRLADVQQRYASMKMVQQKEIESRFVLYLQAENEQVYIVYRSSGLDSRMVAAAFFEWLLMEMPEEGGD